METCLILQPTVRGGSEFLLRDSGGKAAERVLFSGILIIVRCPQSCEHSPPELKLSLAGTSLAPACRQHSLWA